MADYDGQIGAIQRHIGLEPQVIPQPSKKQQTLSLPEAIDNYDELREHFDGTEWSRYFAEPHSR